MKTSFLITTAVEIEHPEHTTIDNTAVTEAANAGAQALANELVIINPVFGSKRNTSAKRVTARPSNVVTCVNGHRHSFGDMPWSNEHVRPEEAIGQAD
jgi:hypothetical protein